MGVLPFFGEGAGPGAQEMGRVMARDGIEVNDRQARPGPSPPPSPSPSPLSGRQLACARIHSKEGQDYIKAMARPPVPSPPASRLVCFALTEPAPPQNAAANFGAGRGARAAPTAPDGPRPALDMHLVYDEEEHVVEGRVRRVLVHRKGATRAFGPGHPSVPAAYRGVGQPVLIGGSMGTCSYVLVGTEGAMRETFGSTCHGAGRVQSRNAAKKLDPKEARAPRPRDPNLETEAMKADAGRGRSPGRGLPAPQPVQICRPHVRAGGAQEEAPGAYKDVTAVVDTCHEAGTSKKVVKLVPIGVIKG
eukprot:tig00021582_g22599.t1